MTSYDEAYEMERRRRREAVERQRLAAMRAETEAVERQAAHPRGITIVVPWGAFDLDALLTRAKRTPDGRTVILLRPPDPPRSEPPQEVPPRTLAPVPPPPPRLPAPLARQPAIPLQNAAAKADPVVIQSPPEPMPPPEPAPPPEPTLAEKIAEGWQPGLEPRGAVLGTVLVNGKTGKAAVPPLDAFAHHAFVFGKTGMGKTRLQLLLLAEHLAAGCSAVLLESKEETLARAVGLARDVGISQEDTALFLPSVPSRAPGWNPLLEGSPAATAADGLVTALQGLSRGWGDRIDDTLTNALVVLAVRGLSLYELPALLTDADYRKRLLGDRGVPSHDASSWRVAREFFDREYQALPPDALSPLMNKVRKLRRYPFFETVLCARRNTFAFADLWERQTLAGFHLDRSDRGLGDEGAQAFGATVARRLFRAVQRRPGAVPVLLMADEAGVQERFFGGTLTDFLAYARGSGTRLVLSLQHLSGVSSGLLDAALGNAGAVFAFRLGPKDAATLASVFAHAENGNRDWWERHLISLPERTCVVWRPGEALYTMRVADYDPPLPRRWREEGGMVLPLEEIEEMPSARDAAVAELSRQEAERAGGGDPAGPRPTRSAGRHLADDGTLL